MLALDIFCGAGGLTRGLLDAGIKVIAGIDCDARCKRTYEHNNPGVTFILADARQITLEQLRKVTRRKSFKDVLFAGCAPCQQFSQQRKGTTRRRDATLLGAFSRLIEATLPGQVLVENVPGIARVKGNSTFRRFLVMLKRKGYQYEYGVLDAKHFGVPQTRRRLILIAMRGVKPTLPKPKYGPGLRRFVTVRKAISHFPAIPAGGKDSCVPNHMAARITELNLERLRRTPHNGGDRRSWPPNLCLACHDSDYEGHTDVYGRMVWDKPSPTLTGRCHSISNGRYGHPEQDRAISLREAAALQSFPDGYVFYGSSKRIALHIGNAVPVRLAETLGRHILALRACADLGRCAVRTASNSRLCRKTKL
jgi:DNA (cytosine-5)-methyltransferase 1